MEHNSVFKVLWLHFVHVFLECFKLFSRS